MRDVQTERKEALFIIFVARLFSRLRERTRAQEWSVTRGKESRREGAEHSPVDIRGKQKLPVPHSNVRSRRCYAVWASVCGHGHVQKEVGCVCVYTGRDGTYNERLLRAGLVPLGFNLSVWTGTWTINNETFTKYTAFHLAGQDVAVIVITAIVHRNASHLRSEITGIAFSRLFARILFCFDFR